MSPPVDDDVKTIRRRFWRALLRAADRLFGEAAAADRVQRRSVARYLALAAVLALVIFARRPDALLRPEFYGEDGPSFFAEQLRLGFWGATRTLHYGLPYLAARIVAALGAMVPTVAAPLVYNASSIVITALAMATFSLPSFRHLVRSDAVRAAVCLAAVCIPAGQDLFTSPSTLHYFLGIWLVFLSLMPTPYAPAAVGAWCVAGAFGVLSSAAAPLAAPFWVLRGLRGVVRRAPRDLVFATTQIGLVAALAILVRIGGQAGAVTAFDASADDIRGAVGALGWTAALSLDAALLPARAAGWLVVQGTLAVVAPAACATLLLALAFRTLRPCGRVTVIVAAYLFVASLGLILAGRPLIAWVISGANDPQAAGLVLVALGTRHRALPNIALLLLAAGLVDGAQRPRTRVVAAGAWAGALLAWAPGFRIEPFPDLHWPVWAARLDQKITSGSDKPLTIPSYPAPFFNIVVDALPPSSVTPPPQSAGVR